MLLREISEMPVFSLSLPCRTLFRDTQRLELPFGTRLAIGVKRPVILKVLAVVPKSIPSDPPFVPKQLRIIFLTP